MNHLAENIKLAQGLRKSLQYNDIRVGWLGKIDAAGVVNPDPMDGLELPYVWVRFEENGEAVRAINLKVASRMPNVRVHVGRGALNGQLTILGLAEETAIELGDIAPTLNIPDRIADLIMELLDLNRVKFLHVTPGDTAFDVEVEPGFYWHEGEFRAWSGGTINIASSVPSGFNTKRPVLIGIDPATETLVSYDGDVVFMTVPPLRGKMFPEATIAQTVVDAAMDDVFWVACIPITVNDTSWTDLYRVTALQFTVGNGAATGGGKVLVSAADTTEDYLYPSMTAGNGITLAIANPAADEKVSITVNQAQLSLGSLGTRAFTNLSDVPASYATHALKGLRVNAAATGVEFHDYNGDFVNVTGDTMSGLLSINTTNTDALNVGTIITLGADDSSIFAGAESAVTVNQAGHNLTNSVGIAGHYALIGVTGASGTVTGSAGLFIQTVKSGLGTLTSAYGVLVDTTLKSAGTLTNHYGVMVKSQTVGTNNYGVYVESQSGGTLNYALYTNAGLNRLGDGLSIIPVAGTGAANSALTITAAAHTALTAATEYTDIDMNLNRLVQWNGGNLTTQRAIRIQAPSYRATSTSTFSNAITLDIDGPPSSSINMTITNAFALRVGGRTQINGAVDINPPAVNSGWRTGLLFVAAAHASHTASTEYIDVNINLARNMQFATGALATNRAVYIQAPTYRFVGPSTLTDAVTVEISGPPTAGTNATITNPYALRVASGVSRFNGPLWVNGTGASTNHFVLTAASGQNNDIFQVKDFGTTNLFRLNSKGALQLTPGAGTGGPESAFLLTAPAHTALNASSEHSDVQLNLNRTAQWNTGALATQRFIYIRRPTIAFVGASTVTDTATVYIENAPAAGTNATITSSYALWIDDGAFRLDGAFNHRGTTLGLFNATPATQSTGWSVTNPSTLKAMDVSTITHADLARVVGTLVTAFLTYGALGA